MHINFYRLDELTPPERRKIMRRSEVDISALLDTVRPVLDEVREHGDEALIRYTGRFDGVELTAAAIKVTPDEFARARTRLEPEVKTALETAAANIETFHAAQMPEKMWFHEVSPGIMAGEKVTPITSVGLYVPRGKGSFPSVMLMLATPAMVAGVSPVVVCTPPTPEGTVDDASLFAAEICGIEHVYKVGGSQAIAALAYGTETVPGVDKVLGPGNMYVSAAKRLLYGTLDVGTPAGPSEAIILGDETTRPETAARDLLIEAEHGPDSSALLVTHSPTLAAAARELLPRLVAELPEKRREFCTAVLSGYGGIVLTASLDASLEFINAFAPEHLEVLVDEPMALLPRIKNAGEILLGKYSPITIGNFCLGVNAILPTGGAARTVSCVTVWDFLKRTSIGYLTRDGYDRIHETARVLADYEGFPAHANAIRQRFAPGGDQ